MISNKESSTVSCIKKIVVWWVLNQFIKWISQVENQNWNSKKNPGSCVIGQRWCYMSQAYLQSL